MKRFNYLLAVVFIVGLNSMPLEIDADDEFDPFEELTIDFSEVKTFKYWVRAKRRDLLLSSSDVIMPKGVSVKKGELISLTFFEPTRSPSEIAPKISGLIAKNVRNPDIPNSDLPIIQPNSYFLLFESSGKCAGLVSVYNGFQIVIQNVVSLDEDLFSIPNRKLSATLETESPALLDAFTDFAAKTHLKNSNYCAWKSKLRQRHNAATDNDQ